MSTNLNTVHLLIKQYEKKSAPYQRIGHTSSLPTTLTPTSSAPSALSVPNSKVNPNEVKTITKVKTITETEKKVTPVPSIKPASKNNHDFLMDLVRKDIKDVQSFLMSCKSDAERLIENNNQQNILVLASICNRLDIITLLLTEYPKLFKDNINHTDYRGFTALSWSCYYGHPQITAALMQAGADPFIPEHYGNTPIKLALSARDEESVKLLRTFYQLKKVPDSYKKYIKECQLINQIGHGLGVSACVPVVRPEKNPISILVPTEISTTKVNELKLFSHLLKHYITHLEKNLKTNLSAENSRTLECYKLILTATQKTIDYYRFQNKVTAETLATQYKNEIIIVPVASDSHEIALVLYKDWAILCDRGDLKRFGAGTIVFTIRNKANITPEFIKSLYSKPRSGVTMEMIYQKIFDKKTGILDLKDVVAKFATKLAKHDTCSYNNVKVAIIGILYLLRHEKLMLGKDKSAHPKLAKEAETYAYSTYKKGFSVWSREYLIEYFSAKASLAHEKKYDTELYFRLGEAILDEHHGQPKPVLPYDRQIKKKQELERAQRLFLNLLKIDPQKAQKLADNLKARNKSSRFIQPVFKVS